MQSLYSLTGLDAGCAVARRKEGDPGLGAGTGGPAGGRDPGSGSGAASLVPAAARFHAVVIDCAPLLFLDVAGLATLQELHRDYGALGISLLLACCNPSVTDTLRRGGFLGEDQGDAAEDGQLFPSVHCAVQAAHARHQELAAANSIL